MKLVLQITAGILLADLIKWLVGLIMLSAALNAFENGIKGLSAPQQPTQPQSFQIPRPTPSIIGRQLPEPLTGYQPRPEYNMAPIQDQQPTVSPRPTIPATSHPELQCDRETIKGIDYSCCLENPKDPNVRECEKLQQRPLTNNSPAAN